MNFKALVCFILLTRVFDSVQPPVREDRILGKWISAQKNVIVEVYRKNNDFKAKIVWFDDSDDPSRPMNVRLDHRNPDPVLQKRRVIGSEVLRGLAYNPQKDCWENGFIYDAKSGREWNSAVSLSGDDVLSVRGYWHVKLLGKTLTFKRVK
ncbi:DUF2147 domain-containing protein [Hufsiella ginkgonis]|uniref:DUF2147 domain-containing protein n=1 Tax=Hufsiella ginkgonis TaxID=2695274 RepID=A0A7K1XU69_9SPHI|nr:DUF2147 domain-containing protein [Hufsiella ginkgonis]MXV14561.1 DUF2147 domain-containing protein [Hufsiella ginkgonis]